MRIRFLVPALGAVLLFPAAASAATAKKQYYVSLGDSYAVGYQPGMGSTKDGFADQTVKKAKKKGYKLTLVNFGCGGATTTSIIKTKGCKKDARALHPPVYTKQTQADAAAAFLRAHRGEVKLVTISIGGNDVTACARAGAGDPVACVGNAVNNGIKKNLAALVKKIRKAAGPKVEIVGTTYPDVILGEIVRPNGNKDLANLSVVAFKSIINPALKDEYGSVKGKFVDVTEATGAYGSMDTLVDVPPYGQIPEPVAKVCKLTWYCEKGDIHSKKAGYGIIAGLIVGDMPALKQ